MKLLRWSLLPLLGTLFLLPAFAENRLFPGLPTLSRQEWWADESLRRMTNAQYENFLQFQLDFEEWLSGSVSEDPDGKFAAKKARDILKVKREIFLQENYPEERVINETIDEEQGNKLRRPRWYHRNKTKIVIHHTATNERYTNTEKAMSGVRDIYRQHAVNNGRWDIGYNFLIDPLGNIYEGRSGGPDIVGAHADRNNTSTLGVSLIGNFTFHEPSLEMRQSLKKLLVGLMLQYDIDPMTKQSYFTPIDKEPRLEVHEHPSIVGHKDTKSTACPGENVMELLPTLRTEVDEIKDMLDNRDIDSQAELKFLPEPIRIRADQDQQIVTYPYVSQTIRSCVLFGDEKVKLEQCGGNGQALVLTIRRSDIPASGRYPLLVEIEGWALRIDVIVVREDELDELEAVRREEIWPAPLPSAAGPKVEKKIPLEEIQDLQEQEVNVLLYEATASLDRREFLCESGCSVQLDDQHIDNARIVHLVPSVESGSMLQVFVDQRMYLSSSVELENPDSVITLENFFRGTDRYPLDYFRGDISVTWQPYTRLNRWIVTWRTIVNHVSLSDYLHGMAETVETQHPQKLRTMAILAKQYALYYIWWNTHPSIPEGVTYNTIDDPRLFQKYVGAGIEQVTPKRQEAVDTTVNEIVMYDDFLPILPYFHCSAGFTRSGKERFGRTDTPWLEGDIDVASCPTGKFDGHGVGLSGDGAEKLAQKGATYKQILEYYYKGIQIIKNIGTQIALGN